MLLLLNMNQKKILNIQMVSLFACALVNQMRLPKGFLLTPCSEFDMLVTTHIHNWVCFPSISYQSQMPNPQA